MNTKSKSIICVLFASLMLAYTSILSAATAEDVSDATCPDADIFGSKLITDVCWTCLFPMRIMGATYDHGTGNTIPPGASNEIFHWCQDENGVPSICLPIGMWAPAKLVEVVKMPYCSPTMNTKFQNSVRMLGGNLAKEQNMDDKSFHHYHYFSFPLYFMLDLLFSQTCIKDNYTDMDLLYASEVDPTWNDDELALLLNPEVLLFANPIAQAACAVDCKMATAGIPTDHFYWCAGCEGSLYPFSGNSPVTLSLPRVTSLISARAVAALHRRGLARKTFGNENLCGGSIFPTIPKTQYKLQQLYPLAEADGNCCHPIGASTLTHNEWRVIPGVGEDFIYILWRYTDCCI